MDTCLAAVHNGADAIYVGVPHWNARGRTPDLSLTELQEMIRFCRIRGVRVFFAMNVLVFESELQDLAPYLVELIRLEPDAFIIQDLGLARLIASLCPAQELHASTQMTLASSEAVDCVRPLGFRRVVLARELSLAEIQQLRASTHTELEVFVHGALCVSYSGQCLTSESFGGRSANRGQCAQSCRLPYQMLVDGKPLDQKGRNYLFSPQDLCAIELVGDLAAAGVNSFKIEGRLKSPEYVAAVTAAYRTLLDTGRWESRQLETLEALFSRGLFTGWLKGTDHQKLVGGFYSSHQGVQIGTVLENVARDGVTVARLEHVPLCVPGDGLVFVDPIQQKEVGGRLYGIQEIDAQRVRLEFSRDLDLRSVQKGWQIWRNDSPSLEALVRKSFTDREHFRRVPVQAVLSGNVGEPLQLRLEDAQGHRIQIAGTSPLEPSRSGASADITVLEEELGALGGSAYRLAQCGITVDSKAFVPRKLVRELRQQAVVALDSARLQWKHLAIKDPARVKFPRGYVPQSDTILLNLVVRKESQLEALKPGLAIDTIYLDFDYGRRHEKALERIAQLGYRTGITTLRIHKSLENRYLEKIQQLDPQRVLVRSLGALHWLRSHGFPPESLYGDHSLNVCNSMTSEWLLAQGLQGLHPSWDLNRQQLGDLVRQFGGASFEVGLHFYVPTYHMEHCVFAAYLSKGSSYPDCKVPCMTHEVEVQDHKGEKHFLQSDAECRNTLYLGRPQSMVRLVPELRAQGVRRFRLEMLQESPAKVLSKVDTFSAFLRGERTADQVILAVDALEKYGITEGQLFNETKWVDRKKS